MSSFGVNARRHQGNFRQPSESISQEGRSPSDLKGQRNPHLLALGHEIENLFEPLRGDDGAVKFFADRSLRWWRSARSGDTRGKDVPTRNMASSQIACVNFLLPLIGIEGGLAAVLRAIDSDVQDVMLIDHKKSGTASPVELEWIGVDRHGMDQPLEKDARAIRGALTTSIDAFLVATTATAKRAYLLEWKYVEEYRRENGSHLRRSPTPRRRYQDLYNDESSSFNGVAPMEELLYEPFYQLMRLRLLADRMVKEHESGVSDAKVVVVVPEENTAYREVITSPPLNTRFPNCQTVSEVFRATLKRPDEDYGIVCPSTLVSAVERECGNAVSEWVKYQRERYCLTPRPLSGPPTPAE